MPRQPDPDLQERILNAAQRLWKKGAEKTLTMRAVAKAAKTNTPAVYRRFRNREDILRALLRRIQLEVAEALRPCRSPQEVCERYIEYALAHPHEYELFYTHAYRLPAPGRSGRAASMELPAASGWISDCGPTIPNCRSNGCPAATSRRWWSAAGST